MLEVQQQDPFTSEEIACQWRLVEMARGETGEHFRKAIKPAYCPIKPTPLFAYMLKQSSFALDNRITAELTVTG